MDIDKLTLGRPQGLCLFCFSTLLDIDKLTHRKDFYPVFFVLVLCWILINLHINDRADCIDYCFSTLLDIDKLTRYARYVKYCLCFSTLLDIDKLTHRTVSGLRETGFSTLLDIDKLTQRLPKAKWKKKMEPTSAP